MNQVIVHIDTPIVTVEKFAELVGVTVSAVRNKIFKGSLPVLRTKTKEGKKDGVFINMALLTQEAFGAESYRTESEGIALKHCYLTVDKKASGNA